MKKEKIVIKTAEIVAFSRAYHYRYENKYPVLEDKYAILLTSVFWRIIVKVRMFSFIVKKIIYSGLFPIINQHIYREKYVENILFSQLEEVKTLQYVILGAGLNSFAFRYPNHKNIEIFELDLEATQREKIRRFQKITNYQPKNLHFIPIDFNKEYIGKKLRTLKKFKKHRKTIFNWMGVTYYLPLETLKKTLKSIFEVADDAIIMFDFLISEELLKGEELIFCKKMKKVTSKKGEEMILEFHPIKLKKIISDMGYNCEIIFDKDLQKIINPIEKINKIPKCLGYCSVTNKDIYPHKDVVNKGIKKKESNMIEVLP